MKDKYILTVQEDSHSGELYLELPLEVIDQVGWCEDDILEWFDNGNGSWTIEKQK